MSRTFFSSRRSTPCDDVVPPTEARGALLLFGRLDRGGGIIWDAEDGDGFPAMPYSRSLRVPAGEAVGVA